MPYTRPREDGVEGEFTPAHHGLIAWTFDPVIPASTQTLAVAGRAYVVRLKIPAGVPAISTVYVSLTSAGSGMTEGQSFIALYNPAKELIGITADQSAIWGFSGLKAAALTATSTGSLTNPPAGDYFVAFWANASTTLPTFLRGTANVAVNVGLTGETSRVASADSSLTTTAPDPLGALTAYSCGFWIALA